MERPATVLNSLMEVTRAGGALGIPGLYVTGDPGGVDENAKIGNLGIRIGLGWAKCHTFATGPVPGDEVQPRRSCRPSSTTRSRSPRRST